MPYFIQQITQKPARFKVYSLHGNKKHYFSKKPLTYKVAYKQWIALNINAHDY